MIEITRTGNVVYISVTLTIATFPFAFTCADEWVAKMLVIFLRDQLDKRIKAVREEEYRAGLKDARAKKDDRRDWFSSRLELGNKK